MTKEELKLRIEADYHYIRDHHKADKFEAVRKKAKELALTIIEIVPDGRELEICLEKVEEACMHASASIGRAKV